jgi:hypothetical protein
MVNEAALDWHGRNACYTYRIDIYWLLGSEIIRREREGVTKARNTVNKGEI